MINLKELNQEIKGFEGDCIDIDNKMMDLGFSSEAEGYTDDNIESGVMVYVSSNYEEEEQYYLNFEIIKSVKDEEGNLLIDSILKIKSIEEC